MNHTSSDTTPRLLKIVIVLQAITIAFSAYFTVRGKAADARYEQMMARQQKAVSDYEQAMREYRDLNDRYQSEARKFDEKVKMIGEQNPGK